MSVEQAVEAIQHAKRCIVFSGAGASADSGIGTFRGEGGAWSGFTGAIKLAWGGTPFGWRWTPGLVWSRFVDEFYGPIAEAVPHDGLVALAELQQKRFGSRMSFITMNVDGLHQAAGSEHVAEVHGSVKRFRCSSCDATAQPDLPLDPSNQPRCQVDHCGGRVRPDVTLFLESLPEDQFDAANEAIQSLSRGDVMLIVGTSSVVYPAADLPSVAKRRGATLIEFNLEMPTPLSSLVKIAVPGRAADTLRACVNGVLQQPQSVSQ
eukprot:TRINITY_DN34164_c0_g2_i1.p1 TRINITY_DN34164_c0_g2~~TRINITY_DN34164_c0_g2_i1.p1  ORF type:complete len:264 (-),score=55.36 TRINITY_DN34164_c0_g2_i1:83-874(-)